MTVKRGEIYYADLSPVVGSEQGGIGIAEGIEIPGGLGVSAHAHQGKERDDYI